MAKYCTKCGKERKDGKPCDCQAKEQSQEKVINDQEKQVERSNTLIDFIHKPFDTSKKYIDAKKTNQSWGIIAIVSLFLSLLFVEGKANAISMNYFYAVSYPYFRYFLIYGILIFAAVICFNAVIQALIKWVLKKDIYFESLINITAISLLPIGYMSIISLLCFWIFGCSFSILTILGLIYSSILFLYNMGQRKEIDQNKFIYIFLGAMLLIGILWMI